MLTIKQCEDKIAELKSIKRYLGNENPEYTTHLDRLHIAYTKELTKAYKRGEKKVGVERHRNGVDIR